MLNSTNPTRGRSERAAALIRVNEVPDEFSHQASKAAAAKSAAIKKEGEVLESILTRFFGGVLYLDMLYLKNNRLILVDLVQEIPMRENAGVRASNQLILSLDKAALIHHTTVSQWPKNGKAWYGYKDEQDISCQEAIEVFGLEAICESLADQLKSQPSPQAQVSEYQERIDRADRLLAAAQEAIGQDGLVEIKEQSQ